MKDDLIRMKTRKGCLTFDIYFEEVVPTNESRCVSLFFRELGEVPSQGSYLSVFNFEGCLHSPRVAMRLLYMLLAERELRKIRFKIWVSNSSERALVTEFLDSEILL